jgi:hypothetical protein
MVKNRSNKNEQRNTHWNEMQASPFNVTLAVISKQIIKATGSTAINK